MVSHDIMNEDDTSSSFSSHAFEYSSSSLSSTSIVITKTKSNQRKSMLVINGYNFQFKNFINEGKELLNFGDVLVEVVVCFYTPVLMKNFYVIPEKLPNILIYQIQLE